MEGGRGDRREEGWKKKGRNGWMEGMNGCKDEWM